MKSTSKLFVVTLAACCCGLRAQPMTMGASYTLATPYKVAPGQLITLLVGGLSSSIYQTVRASAGADLPTSLAGITGGYTQILGQPAPPRAFLEVHPYWGCPGPNAPVICTPLAAITVQIPFEAQCESCASGVQYGMMSFLEGDAHGSLVWVNTFPDQVHILTTCDAFMVPQAVGALASPNGLPCPSVVTHAGGLLVSVKDPANAGEEVVAYAVGLGQTTPPSATGKLVTAAVPTQTTFGLDFNYRPNALAAKPLPSAPPPVFAGATPGYVGLYQVNFVVPPVPAGTPACVDPAIAHPPGLNIVQSNLTVSVGGGYSFDAARICVAVPNL
jgi:uncharacterized protein (TIGR03437 family)